MDTQSLRSLLREVLQIINDARAPLILEPYIRNPETFQLMANDQLCRDLLSQIATYFQDAEPRYRVLHLIQRGLTDYERAVTRKRIGKSLHDIKGNFLWCQRKCSDLFQHDLLNLQQENLFELMDVESQSQIFSVHGPQLINAEDLRSVVISYSVLGVRLVSRCTPVYYTNGGLSSRFGIFVETRKSRRGNPALRTVCPQSPAGSFIDSAMISGDRHLTPSFFTMTGSDLFQTPITDIRKTFLTPSPGSSWPVIKMDTATKEETLTAFSITPLLSSEEPAPEKKQKLLEIREFMTAG